VLIVCKDGTYRIIGPEEKVLIPGKILYLKVFDPEEGQRFTVVYRDSKRIGWAKKVHIKAFIKDREYELIKDKKGKVDMLIEGDCRETLHLDFVPAKRQRVHEARFDLSILDFVGTAARGRRLAPKPVARLRKLRKSEIEAESGKQTEVEQEDAGNDQPSLFDEE
jgi:hypothetical protein